MKMSKPIKAGMILECTAQGPDAKIYPHVLKTLCPGMEVEKPETMTNKKNLVELGPEVAQILLQTGCDVVFLIWDRMPKWDGTGKCAEAQSELVEKLAALGIDLAKIVFCCIDEMLESWIVADGRGITAYFQGKTTHKLEKFKDAGPSKPKERITNYNSRYNDFTDDLGIVQAMPDFDRAAKGNASFGEFCAAVRRWCA